MGAPRPPVEIFDGSMGSIFNSSLSGFGQWPGVFTSPEVRFARLARRFRLLRRVTPVKRQGFG